MNTTIDDHYIVNWLISNPDFFIRQEDCLTHLKLTSPYSHRTISLQERQLEILREKVRNLELRIAELLRYGHKNSHILDKLHLWLISLLSQTNLSPEFLNQSLCQTFSLPFAHLYLWTCTESSAWRPIADKLDSPRCGPIDMDSLFLKAASLLNNSQIVSLALIPLLRPLNKIAATSLSSKDARTLKQTTHQNQIERNLENKIHSGLHEHREQQKLKYATSYKTTSIGLWVLGSYDIQRFSAEMETAYLTQIGELGSTALLNSEQVCEN